MARTTGPRARGGNRRDEELWEEGKRANRRMYWESVKAIAEEAAKIEDDDDRETFIHESVDGNHYVIYTHAQYEAMLATENDDAWQDAGAELGEDPLTVMAFYAMRADVEEEVQRLLP